MKQNKTKSGFQKHLQGVEEEEEGGEEGGEEEGEEGEEAGGEAEVEEEVEEEHRLSLRLCHSCSLKKMN